MYINAPFPKRSLRVDSSATACTSCVIELVSVLALPRLNVVEGAGAGEEDEVDAVDLAVDWVAEGA